MLAFVLGLAFAREAAGVQLRDVLANAPRYHGQTVTVTGIARGDAGRFMLFSRLSDALNIGSQNYADVAGEDWSQRTPHLTLRKVRVTGVVNANYHGHWGNPCAILLKKFQVLSGPVAPWDEKLMVFRNETGRPILLKFGLPPTATEFEVRPSECFHVGPAGDTRVIASSLAGSEITRLHTSARTDSPFYDRANAAFYYRVRTRAIEPVTPAEAKSWGWSR